MKKINFFILFLFTLAYVSGQNEASFWYFGQNAGLRFDSETGSVTAITDGQLNTFEGCTTISDTSGNLIFYTDGRSVWNRNHQIMPNGDYFAGTGLLGDPSSTSSGLIVPKPEDASKYYIFTVDEPHHNNASAYPSQFNGNYDSGGSVPESDDGFNNGFNYSLVDLTLNGGLGDVVNSEKNVPLITYDEANEIEIRYKCSEKITAVRAVDCSSFWVITHFGDSFYAFKVDTNGVSTVPVISTVGQNIPIEGYRRNSLGYLKASPDASNLISANFGEATLTAGDAGGGIYLFDFDNETGIVSNSLELYSAQNNNSPYGVEFSAENRKVYATVGFGVAGNGPSQVLQWDLESADIPNSIQIIHSSNSMSAGALQLGIDRKIYRAQFGFGGNFSISRYIGVINNPEADGLAANYNEQGVLLDVTGLNQNTSRIGLPPFIQSLFNSQIDIIRNGLSTTELKLCTSDTYTLIADDILGADYVWTKNELLLSETSNELFIDEPGYYEVYIEPNNGECPIEGSAVVGVFDLPIAHQPSDVVICDDNSNDGSYTFDFTTKNDEVLQNQDSLVFNVRYFITADDALNSINEISFPFTNTANPQTIYVRVDHTENTNCFDLNSFQVQVFNSPQISQLNTIEFCDDSENTMDGIASVNLGELVPAIIGNQDSTQINVTFHSSQNDADNNNSPLPLNYTNSNPYTETIFVRTENTNNTLCYNTDNFELLINDAPIANNVSILQCDEDGMSDGFTLFNINNHLADITANNSNRDVVYFSSLFDAENNSNELNGDTFENYINPQTIIAKVINTITGCFNYSEVILEVSTTSSNNTSLHACDYDGIEDGLTTFNLEQANTSILAGAPEGLNLAYFETYNDALLENNPLSTTYTNTTPYNQTIYARVENENACYGISEIDLTVYELPNISIELETIYCLNSFPETISINGGVINDLPNNYSYEWSTGESTTEIEVNAPGLYKVKVYNSNGCFKERRIIVAPSNSATITNIEVIDATQNNSISIFVSGEGDYEYALDNSNGPYQDNSIFNNVQPGLYTVYVRDKNNCGLTEQLVSVIGFPKYFTPNNDGVNDFWQVKGLSSQFQASSSIFIFNRYGKLLKELYPLGPGWDGTFNGAKLPTSDYWFNVELQDGRTFTGHFTLKQ